MAQSWPLVIQMISKLYSSSTRPADSYGHPSSERFRPPMAAGDRRNRDLHQLAGQGCPVVFVTRWRARIGPLSIWLYSGRWWNEATGRRGRINSLSMQELIRREASDFQAKGSQVLQTSRN